MIAAVLAVFILAQHPTGLQMLAILVITSSVLVEMFWSRIGRVLGSRAA